MSEIESLRAEVAELRKLTHECMGKIEALALLAAKLEKRPYPREPKGDCFAELANILRERRDAGNPF